MTDGSLNRLRWLLRFVALAFGAANAGAAVMAESMNEDGMHYLDQGDAWMRGDWSMAISGTWSPLYSVILGIVMRVVRPSMTAEFPVVQLVNFGIFVIALACFEFLWREAAQRYYEPAIEETTTPERFSPWIFMVLGYSFFIWSTTTQIRLFAVTPDMLVAALVFLAAGFMLRIVSLSARPRDVAALGVVLGVAYLAKAAMFPMGLFTLAVAGTVLVRSHRPARMLTPAVIAFVVVAGAFIVPLSLRVGHVTFSEVGRTSYLRHVLEAPFPHYESGLPQFKGEPLHPVDRAPTRPPVYRFAGVVAATYPLAYDQGYWFAGVRGRFSPGLQARALVINVQRYFNWFIREQGAMTGIALVLLVMLWRRYQRLFASGGWALELVGFGALAMYALVYAEARYLAPFFVILWAGLLISTRLRPEQGTAMWLHATGLALIVSVALNVFSFHLDGLSALTGFSAIAPSGPVSGSSRPASPASEVATALRDLGLQRGDSIGVIGTAIEATWARLRRLRIVADVDPGDVDAFWTSTNEQQGQVVQAFADVGVRAIVAEPPDADSLPPNWQRVGGTGYVIRFISSGGGPPTPLAPTR